MKAGTQNHLKVKRLMRLLNAPMYRVVGILETLWLLCADCCDEGNVGKYSDEEIADYLGWDGPQTPSELVRALSDSGWTDPDDAERLVVHDWLEHCPEYIRDRVRKRLARGSKPRKQKTYEQSKPDKVGHTTDTTGLVPSIPNQSQPNQSQPNPTNPNPTNPNTPASATADGATSNASPSTHSNGTPSDSTHKPSKPAYSASFERWYGTYPRKIGKGDASAVFGRTLPKIAASRGCSNAEALEWLIGVTELFAASPAGTAGQYTPHPATWLSQGRYDDDPQEWKRNGSNQRKLDIGPGQRFDEGKPTQDGIL